MSSGPTAAASAARDPHATIAMLRHALEHMPGNVDAMVGLAGVHLQTGSLDQASQWCGNALAAVPGHATAEKVRAAIADAYVRQSTREVVDGQLDVAIETLARGAALNDSARLARFGELFTLARRWFQDAAGLGPVHNAVRLSIPVWGGMYVDAVCTGLLRSLLAPGNVPALARNSAVTIEFTTREADRHALESAAVVRAIGEHAEISFTTIPDRLLAGEMPRDFSYWVMSAAHYGSAARARHSGTAVSFLTADMVLADGSLDAAHRVLRDGAHAVLVRALELDREALPRSGDDGAAALSVAPDELVRMALTRVKSALPDGWDGKPDSPFDIASCAWFPIDGGVALHGFHLLPLFLSAELIGRRFPFDLLTVDTRFVRLALGDDAPDGRVRIIDNADEIAVVSTLRDAANAPGPKLLKREKLGRWAAGWCFTPGDAAYFDWCFRHRTVYRPGRKDAAPPPSASEREAVAAVLQAYAATAAAQLMHRLAPADAAPG
jgi:Tetratricopeptide repeat